MLFLINRTRSLKIHESIRPAVLNVIKGMADQGFPAMIATEVWRSPELQLEKFNTGRSQLRWGFHCAKVKGEPASLAADIVHESAGWFADKEYAISVTDEMFWLRLGQQARKNRLRWGGFFGLTQVEINNLAVMFDIDNPTTFQYMAQEINAKRKRLGWDPAHVETSDYLVSQAERLFS